MGWLARLFGRRAGPALAPAPASVAAKGANPFSGISAEEINATLDARRLTLDRAVSATPSVRVARPDAPPLWEPLYNAAYASGHVPAHRSRSEAVCLLVGAFMSYYEGDGIDNGLFGNYGEAETADSVPALRLIGCDAVADVVDDLLVAFADLVDLPADDYFAQLKDYDIRLVEAGIDEVYDSLDDWLDRNHSWV